MYMPVMSLVPSTQLANSYSSLKTQLKYYSSSHLRYSLLYSLLYAYCNCWNIIPVSVTAPQARDYFLLISVFPVCIPLLTQSKCLLCEWWLHFTTSTAQGLMVVSKGLSSSSTCGLLQSDFGSQHKIARAGPVGIL